MRHGKKLSKLSRPTDQRLAILKSLTRELFIRRRISTTLSRGRAAQKIVEKLVALAKKGGLSAEKLALRVLPDKTVIKNLFKEIPALFKDRKSGFTRVIKCGIRRGDAAQKVILEMVEKPQS